MPETADRPLLSFPVFAFNQERFIREAVEAALAQTYSPLEVILSDDCSQDRTFEIMQELAAAYHGPHQLVLNRNPVRRSIGGHVNRVLELARGELIAGAAGDDISLPQRTQTVFEAWDRTGRRATSIHSSFTQIDEHGQTIQSIGGGNTSPAATESFFEQEVEPLAYVATLQPVVFGCAHAFSRGLFYRFGELEEHIIHEDNIMAFRSILAGRLLFINEPLVKYRVHGNNVFIRQGRPGTDRESIERQEERFRRDFRNRETMYDTFLSDLEKAKNMELVDSQAFGKVFAEAARLRELFSLQRQFFERGLVGKCRILSRLRRQGLKRADFQRLARRLVPRSVLTRFRLARGYAALAVGRPLESR